MRSSDAVVRVMPFAMPSLPKPFRQTSPILATAVQPVSGIASSSPIPPKPKAAVTIIPELCKGCELCVYACPSGNLTLSPGLNAKGYHPAVFSYNGKRGPCTACGICYWICPDMAISEIRRLKQ